MDSLELSVLPVIPGHQAHERRFVLRFDEDGVEVEGASFIEQHLGEKVRGKLQ